MGADPPQNSGFTGVGSQTFDASMLSIFSSISSEFEKTATGPFTGFGGSATTTGSGSGASSTGASNSGSGTATSTTFATSASPTAGAADSGTQTLNSSATTNTASNAAASTTDGPVTVSEKSSCNSISCSSALKAAVAVPIVVAAIAAIFLFFCCARRRRRKQAGGASISEKRPLASGKKLKWTRHLRVFSFDAEMLMGGRFSGSNSLRSRGVDGSVLSDPAPSSRDGSSSVDPSLHSVEEVAPPYRDYRDMISHATPPSPLRSIPAITTTAADPIPRPSSTATAPPPYRSIVPGTSPEPASPSTVRNPFSDSAPVSPIDESPFNDPPGTTLAPATSRGSSMYRSVMTDDAGSPEASDAGSIMEAVVGRRVSVRKGGATSGGSS